ncbi:MAG TPA: DNA-binding domain-containing protein, partial [Chthoniobacteraceae bacterium]|nr:DNA-binding domain-containing protein [Chthoniobacteraceae bacterium]
MRKSAPPRSNSKLADIQALMSQAVMRPLASGERTQRTWIDGAPASQVAATIIKPNDRLSSLERLQIYNQQYWWRLLSCFSEDFRGVRAIIGQRKFDRLAVAYLEKHGSQSWSLRDLGQFMPGFLRERPDLTKPHNELALDMARVEWARVVAFDGPS